MRHFLGAEGEDIRKGDVYAAIKRLVAGGDASSIRLLMSRMERLSVLYSRIETDGTEPHPELSRYFNHFRRLDFGTVYPLLLALYEDYVDGQFSIGEFVDVLRILHSFIIRRMVVGVPSNSLAGVFISLCKNKPVTETPSAWLSAALGHEEKNRRWPADTEFLERWIHAPMYGSRACQIILECIEQHHGHHEAVQFDQATVEHVMPQTLTPEWEEILGANVKLVHDEWLHTIGNLTLTGYNPELSNKPYAEKRGIFALSHFELNRCFGECEGWGSAQICDRAKTLFKSALQIWPRPAQTSEKQVAADRSAPAAFHPECIRVVERHLSVNLSKLSQTRYESGDGQSRLICAVSAEHNELSGIPYYWFAVHRSQLDFLEVAPAPWICFGCGSSSSTLLLPLSLVQGQLEFMSMTKTDDRHYWHAIVQKKSGRLFLRLLGAKDGPDLSDFNIAEDRFFTSAL